MGKIPNNTSNLATTNAFISDLYDRRGKRTIGGESIRIVEYNGGQVIEPTAFEPEAISHNKGYYYNAITNTLYKKVLTKDATIAYWSKVSD